MDEHPPILPQAVDPDLGQLQVEASRLGRLFRLGYWACVIVVAGLFGFYAQRQWQVQQDEFDKSLETNAHLLAGAMQGKLAQYIVLADTLAASLRREPELLTQPTALAQRLMQAQRTVPGIAVIRVIDQGGRVLASSLRGSQLVDLRAEPPVWAALLQAREQQRPVVGPLNQITSGRAWVLPLRMAYPAAGKAPAFWIGLGLDKRTFDAYWAMMLNDREEFLRPVKDEGFILARQDGYVLARWPDVPAARFRDFYLRPQSGALVRSLQSHPAQEHSMFSGVVPILNQMRIGYWARVRGLPDLAVSVSQPRRRLYAAYWQKLWPAGLAVTLLLGTLTLSYTMLRLRMRA